MASVRFGLVHNFLVTGQGSVHKQISKRLGFTRSVPENFGSAVPVLLIPEKINSWERIV